MKKFAVLFAVLLSFTAPSLFAEASQGNAATEFVWRIANKTAMRLSNRGCEVVNPSFHTLTEDWKQKPAFNSVLDTTGASSSAALIAYTIANKDFEVLGTNMTTALCTFATGTGLVPSGGITLNTAGADADQAILAPHLDTNQTQWSVAQWRTDKQCAFEVCLRTGNKPCSITNLALTSNVVTLTTATNHNLSIGQSITAAMLTGPTLFADTNGTYVVTTIPSATTFTYACTHANISTGAATGTLTTNNLKLQTIWTGLKLTTTATIATDDDQFYARYLPTENSGQWQIITSRAGTDKTTVIPGTVTAGTLYRFRFQINDQRKPSLVLNGNTYRLDGSNGETGDDGSGVLTTAISLIPYTGTSANGTTPGTKAIDVMPCYKIQAYSPQ